MPIPLTPLERGFAKLWDPLTNWAVSLERMIGGGAEHNIKMSWLNSFARQLAAPARNYVNRIVDKGEDVLADALSTGRIDPTLAGWSGGKLKAARHVMGLLDEHLQTRRVVLNQADAWANSVMQKYGLTPDGNEWHALRKMVEAGNLRDPRAAALSPLVNQPRDLMRNFFTEAEAKLEMNNWPVVVDAAKVASNPLAFRQVTDGLAQRVLSNEGLSAAAREALVLRPGAPLGLDEVSDLIREVVMQETKMRYRPVQGYTRSPARIFARRLARDIPDEWRVHPFQEMITGLHDEYSFLVDTKLFGRGGRTLNTVVDWLNGVLKPEDYANLPKEALETIKGLRALAPGTIQESNGPLFRELGGMIDGLARATTGSFNEPSWVWAARNGFAPAGAISMMAFCVVPETRILTADLRWVQAWEVKVGDRLLGFEEDTPRGHRGKRRKMLIAGVEATRAFESPLLRVTTTRGSVVVTLQHPFLARMEPQGSLSWVDASNLKPGAKIKFLVEPWKDRSDTWLAGMLDGEGWVQVTPPMMRFGVAQNYGPVYDRLIQEVQASGVDVWKVQYEKTRRLGRVVIQNGAEVMRLLGSLRPTRLLPKLLKTLHGRNLPDCDDAQVLSVENAGEGTAVAIQTDTKTLITEGLFSHNSAIPNMGQALTELIVRGWAPFKKGFIGADVARARLLATYIGQHNMAMLAPDFHQGVQVFNEALLKRPTKGPGAILKGELPSLFNPRWYVDNFGIVQTHGIKGMRSAAEEFLHANGFAGVEDWLRRGSVLVVEDEIASLQQRLIANNADAFALRRVRDYGMDVERFMQIKKPDLEAAAAAFRSGDLDQALALRDWQKAYFHGVGGTQFNYMPGDFPMAFASPLWGSVVLQFRRYSYSQATKVVSHILNEASAGNIAPLLYAAATIPTGGEIIRRARDLVQGRDIVFVEGKPVYAEKPTVQRAKEVRLPLGGIMSVDQRRMLENVVAMGLMGAYSDAMWTMAEDKPLLTASWMTGIFPSEVFNFVSKLASAGSEVVFGPEPGLGYGRVGGPKVQEAVRQTVREVPFLGRLASPHVRWGRSRYQQLREHAMRTFVAGDFDSFNTIQRVLVEQFYSPVTMDDIVNREYRQALKEAGYTGTAPAPGDPSYIEYRQGREQDGLRRKKPVSPADRAAAERKARQRVGEFYQRPEEE